MTARLFVAFAIHILASSAPFVRQGGAQGFEARGEATNYGLAANPSQHGLTGALSWRVSDPPDAIGEMTIGPPLGGSGSTRSARWADTLLILSVSAVGDTIAWLGRVDGDFVAGEYLIVGGQFTGQGGQWQLTGAGLSGVSFSTPRPDPLAIQFLVERTARLRANTTLEERLTRRVRDRARVHSTATDTRLDPTPPAQLASQHADQKEDWKWLWWVVGIGLVIAASAWFARFRVISVRTSRSPPPPGPGDYIVLCPTCGKHPISETRTLWFLYGMLLVARYGTRTVTGCRYCVAQQGLKMLAVSALAGWWSIPWGLATPIVILQNLCELILKPNASSLESVLRRAGIDPRDVRLDAKGLTREQRSLVEGACQILATAIWTDGVHRPREFERALAILKQLTDERISEGTLRHFIAEGRNRQQDLTSLPTQLRQMLLQMAFNIAIVDGVLSLPEIAMLYRVSETLALGKSAVEDLLGLKSDGAHREKDRSKRRSRARQTKADIQRALSILGLSPGVTAVQVRQAWRSAILKFHPDRAGTDKRQQAEFTRRSQDINWAYDILQRDAAVA